MRRDVVTLRTIITSHQLFPVREAALSALRAQVDIALMTLYNFDKANGRLPLSALFVMESSQKPAPGIYPRFIDINNPLVTPEDQWAEVCQRIYAQYSIEDTP